MAARVPLFAMLPAVLLVAAGAVSLESSSKGLANSSGEAVAESGFSGYNTHPKMNCLKAASTCPAKDMPEGTESDLQFAANLCSSFLCRGFQAKVTGIRYKIWYFEALDINDCVEDRSGSYDVYEKKP